MDQVLEIKGFSKKYGSLLAVDRLNLTIPKGEIVGFVGKNGAGKSTVIRSIFDFIKPTEGEILVFGMNSQTMSKEIKERCAYVPSESIFYDGITGKQLLAFSREFSGAKWSEVEELANYFELDLSKKIETLSYGNRKKLSLIQAFLRKAELLVFDEPTNGLDPLVQKNFFKLLHQEKAQGKTIFLSSHNLADVENYCDRVAILKNGILVEYVKMSEVAQSSQYQVTYQAAGSDPVSFEFSNNLNELIRTLSDYDLEDLEIKKKTIAQRFISYYEEGDV